MFRAALILSLAATVAVPAIAQTAGPGLDLLFTRADTDGDGRISGSEMTALKTRQFERADRDGNGRITKDEIAAIRARIERASQAVDAGADRLDRDGDGAVSMAEFTARSPMLALLDIDGDGALSRAEAERARTILQR